ncbi:hypothetical protein RR48_14080 [Papilio machaon]|uniref:Polyhomeotic-proximal chromatin protein n=1 Tax=Papilio machaon TaxID=76193 RepID=A0A194QS23_PAPMA|nr:hypothetical protein RR48_14080 [Papilio machaon]
MDGRERVTRGGDGHGCGVARRGGGYAALHTAQSCFASRNEGYSYNDTVAGLSIKTEILDSIKKKEQEKEQTHTSNFQQQLSKSGDKINSEKQNSNAPVTQHVPAQILSPSHGSGSNIQPKEESKDKTIKVANSTTITLIENGAVNGEKDKDNNNYPKNYFTLEPKNDKKDENNKNSITITRTTSKQSPGGGQSDKTKSQSKVTKRPLQCLETLAEKAGITFEDKYEAANTLLALDKQNNTYRRPELKQPKLEPDTQQPPEEYRYRNPKEEDDKLQPVHTQQFNVPGIGEINLSFLPSPQTNLFFEKNNKSGMNTDIKPQQLVEGQGQAQVVQQQISMAQHEPTQQHHQTVTVVSSMPSSMAHQVQQQQQTGGIQQQASGITTMPPLPSLPATTPHPQQLSADWSGRVQVIQQPLQNNSYLQQLYNAQGPLIMPGNIALHPGLNSQPIQVITAGKPFQGNQLAPHMLTAQGKSVLQGQTAPFPGYATIPTTQNQTFVFSPLGVINSQASIIPTHSQPTVSGIGQQQKTTDMHKAMSGGKVTGAKVGGATGGGQTVPVHAQCVQVSQPVLGTQQPTQAQIISPLQCSVIPQTGGQTMQFAPWQISGALPQVWTGGLQAGTLPAGGLLAPNPIFIRGTQPDAAPSMFIQHSPQNNVQHNNTSVATTATAAKPRASSDGMTKTPRPLSNILPSGGIRPASSVSTQTGTNQSQSQGKHRGKQGLRSPAPSSKQDAANQTANKMQQQMQQQKQSLLVMNSNGQMTQVTNLQDKQPITKNLQQQAIMQQAMQVTIVILNIYMKKISHWTDRSLHLSAQWDIFCD